MVTTLPAFASVEHFFAGLVRAPAPECFDARLIPGVERIMPLDELRDLLKNENVDADTTDAIWRQLARHAREWGEPWTTIATGIALPGQTRMAGKIRHTARARFDEDLASEMMAAFLSALRTADLAPPRLWRRLCWPAWRAGVSATRTEQASELPDDVPAGSRTPTLPYGHPDLLLGRAVAARVIPQKGRRHHQRHPLGSRAARAAPRRGERLPRRASPPAPPMGATTGRRPAARAAHRDPADEDHHRAPTRQPGQDPCQVDTATAHRDRAPTGAASRPASRRQAGRRPALSGLVRVGQTGQVFIRPDTADLGVHAQSVRAHQARAGRAHDLSHLDLFTAAARLLVGNRELPAFTFTTHPPANTMCEATAIRQACAAAHNPPAAEPPMQQVARQAMRRRTTGTDRRAPHR